jgi:translation initiation factor 1 (eIF-1/SUI1)
MRIGFLSSIVLAMAMLLQGPQLSWAEESYRLTSNKEVSEVVPGPPVKVKLKRQAGGKYVWEITGVDVDKVIAADKKLRKYIKEEGLKK